MVTKSDIESALYFIFNLIEDMLRSKKENNIKLKECHYYDVCNIYIQAYNSLAKAYYREEYWDEFVLFNTVEEAVEYYNTHKDEL